MSPARGDHALAVKPMLTAGFLQSLRRPHSISSSMLSAWQLQSALAVRLSPCPLHSTACSHSALADLLGAQKPHLALVASRLTIAIAVVCSGINSILLLLLRNIWGTLFSSEPEIISLVAAVLPLVAAFQLWDGLSGAMGGVLRGAGKPTLGAIVSLAALSASDSCARTDVRTTW